MANDFERLKKQNPVRRWSDTIGGDPEEYHFRAMTEREKSLISMLGLSLSPKTLEVQYTGTPETIREQKLRRVAYQWITADGDHVIDPDDWDTLGDFPDAVVDRLVELCGRYDSEDETGGEQDALKKSA